MQSSSKRTASTAIVCPTSSTTPPATFHPEIVLEGQSTRVLCEMLGAVDVTRPGNHVGHLSFTEWGSVDEALGLVLALQ